MPDPNNVFRDQMVRAVLGTHPAILAKEADPAALESLCRRLSDAASAAKLLVANGYDWPARSLTDLVGELLQRGEKGSS